MDNSYYLHGFSIDAYASAQVQCQHHCADHDSSFLSDKINQCKLHYPIPSNCVFFWRGGGGCSKIDTAVLVSHHCCRHSVLLSGCHCLVATSSRRLRRHFTVARWKCSPWPASSGVFKLFLPRDPPRPGKPTTQKSPSYVRSNQHFFYFFYELIWEAILFWPGRGSVNS